MRSTVDICSVFFVGNNVFTLVWKNTDMFKERATVIHIDDRKIKILNGTLLQMILLACKFATISVTIT